jgi:hypothetical protein
MQGHVLPAAELLLRQAAALLCTDETPPARGFGGSGRDRHDFLRELWTGEIIRRSDAGFQMAFAERLRQMDMVNLLTSSLADHSFSRKIKLFTRPKLLVLDELGYMPIDRKGADALFQVVSGRYEQGSILLTTNRPFKQWGSIMNQDNTLAFALIDRLGHHAEVVLVEGKSYRMKGKDKEDDVVDKR